MQDAGIDRRLGPFELGEVLGRGAFGEVFDAVRRDDGRRFALKLLHDAGAAAVRELKHEARTLWNLPIPGLVTPSELGSWEGRWYVALPRVRGEPLDVAATAWPRDDGDAREQRIEKVVVALSSTVAALHDAGVLHLDLKPSNVLVGADAEVTLLDFGFSRWVTRPPAGALAATAGERGTLRYSAPELLAGERATAAADCYAIGAMLHELLVGEPPRSAWSPSPSLRPRAGPLHRMCAALLSTDFFPGKDSEKSTTALAALRREIDLHLSPDEPASSTYDSALPPPSAHDRRSTRPTTVATRSVGAAGAVAGAGATTATRLDADPVPPPRVARTRTSKLPAGTATLSVGPATGNEPRLVDPLNASTT